MSAPASSSGLDGNDVLYHIIRHQRALISPVDIAGWLGCSERHIYNLAEEGELEKHTLGAEGRAVRVTRRSLISFLLRTANYKPADESAYESIIGLLVNDLSDLAVHRLALRCSKVLSSREHSRRLHAGGGKPQSDQLPLG